MPSPQTNRPQNSNRPVGLPNSQARLPSIQRNSLAQATAADLSKDPSFSKIQPSNKPDVNMKLEQMNYRDINFSQDKAKMLKRADQIEDN